MSWLFGSKQEKKETPVAPAGQAGFDANQISDISSILKSNTLDPTKLHPLAGLDKDIEYLDLDEEKLTSLEGAGNGLLPSRGWTDDLCYGTGTVYVLGLGLGGIRGLNEGLKNLPQGRVDPVTNQLRPVPFKLKLNTVLNQVTKFGPHMGNNAGVLAIMYNLIDSSLDNIRNKHDDLNSLAAGFLSGALFRSSKGLKPMGYSAGAMTLVAAAWCGLKRVIN
ncbi:hypothetical protein KL930_001767 [Ogataea haglerorum]|uniref:Mitochondrial import inner membrane translocase subunit TIM23 n=1 Tax=Ogataea haglerorum TaxID=1937702 RepID=A0AAN6D8L7_9ASCO|nr:uncharacterized protein KL911_001708 [Ogataea haglerorum]KAG7698105.1 hypothetical protein KL915_001822 [Ogataea haglerorum]KAG7699601.1 hypothetical protein KL951_001318 [Ogataea haglerorum]KAG7708327.1 hypothetical protein KL914_002053 [Ogataea haglerorum]KAG7710646.1 hypothetical protein KL950_001559 [Ogataea haglerorum]KAG7721267.1 hypothetical protein KL913_001003 [Ogataea haglerorum]